LGGFPTAIKALERDELSSHRLLAQMAIISTASDACSSRDMIISNFALLSR
jgi:hypothetical protein